MTAQRHDRRPCQGGRDQPRDAARDLRSGQRHRSERQLAGDGRTPGECHARRISTARHFSPRWRSSAAASGRTDGNYRDKNVIGKVLRVGDQGYRRLEQPPPMPIERSAPPQAADRCRPRWWYARGGGDLRSPSRAGRSSAHAAHHAQDRRSDSRRHRRRLAAAGNRRCHPRGARGHSRRHHSAGGSDLAAERYRARLAVRGEPVRLDQDAAPSRRPPRAGTSKKRCD